MRARCFILIAISLTGVAGCQEASSETSRNSETLRNTASATSETSKSEIRQESAAKRKFEFVYGATITDLAPGAEADVWIPIAADTHEQKVIRLNDQTVLPVGVKPQITTEKRFGNQVMHFKAKADAEGKIGPIKVVYQVERKETLAGQTEVATKAEVAEFLKASDKVPVDGSILSKLYGDNRPSGDSRAIGRGVYDTINDRMKYDKPAGMPWGNGDALWACDSRFGNCTDFHSQFNAAMRDLDIASKFEIGFTIPNEEAGKGTIGGYHCWAKFVSGGHWIPVDISEANKILKKIKEGDAKLVDYYFGNMSPDRMTFTTGRDLQLNPPTATGSVNYLVYPHVEVDGEWHKTFEKQFSYRNL